MVEERDERDLTKDNGENGDNAEVERQTQDSQEIKGENGEKETKNNEQVPEEETGDSREESGVEAEEENLTLKGLRQEMEELAREKESYHSQLLRLQADFANYRKRVNREQEKIAFNTKIKMLDDLLPVIDNFERALDSFNTDDEFTRGVEMIYRQLLKLLEKNGVEVIPAEGEQFDHNLHEAVMQVEAAEAEPGIIIEELQKGYILDERVIRPSMVKVSS